MLVNAGANIVLVHTGVPNLFKGMGFIGSPIATAVSQWGQYLSLQAYFSCTRTLPDKGWPGFHLGAFTAARFAAFTWVALPLGIGICLEELQIQTITIMAGTMGQLPLLLLLLLLLLRILARAVSLIPSLVRLPNPKLSTHAGT